MRRPACASGAARQLRLAMSKRSRSGSIGPSPRPRSRWRKPRQGALSPARRAGLRFIRPPHNWPPTLASHNDTPRYRVNAMAPTVLISDALSDAAVQIFKDRGIDTVFQPKLGADKDRLAEMIGDFDGLAIRSATKVTGKLLEKAKKLRVVGRAGIGGDNVDIPAATAKGVIVISRPFGNWITSAEHALPPPL